MRKQPLLFALIAVASAIVMFAQAPQARQGAASPAAPAAQAPTDPAPAAPARGGRGGRGGAGAPAPAAGAQAPAGAATPAGGRGGGAPLEVSTDLTGWISMFDGVSMKGWDGPMPLWHVENGAIVVRRTVDPALGSVYLIWQGGQPKNFEMKFDIKLEGDGANSGLQFRAALLGEVPDRAPVAGYAMTKWESHGYQADITNMGGAGNLIECCNGPRRGLPVRRDAHASMGQVTRSATIEGGPANLIATVGDPTTLRGSWKPSDWNTLDVVARGRTLLYSCNGHLMSVMMDDSPTFFQDHGIIAIQLEGTAPNAAYFKNLWIKLLPD